LQVKHILVNTNKNIIIGWTWWYMPVISAIQEAEAEGS
jgi:hypothetical protein